MPTIAELTTKEAPTWCSGCGDFTILSTIKNSIAELGLEQHNTVLVSGIGCLPPDEQVSVGSQWVCIDHLRKGHTVVNGDGEFTSIEERMVRPFEGDLIEIVPYVSTFNRIRLTPEHPVLCVKRNLIRKRNQINEQKLSNVMPEFIEAGKLEKGDYIVFSFTKKVTDNAIYTKDFCRLLGYYLAEGYVNKGGGRNRDSANVSFAINSDEKGFLNDLIKLSVKLTGKRPYIRQRKNIGNVTEVTICSKELALLLEKIAGTGAGTKKLIEDVMLLPPAKQEEIVMAYFRGDGWHGIVKGGKNVVYRANTLSKVLAIQVQEMLARMGIFASIYIKKTKPHNYKGRIIQPSGQQYMVSFQFKKQFNMTHKTPYGFLIPIGEIKRHSYSGMVHNFQTTNEPHSYLVKGLVVHNCGSKTPHFVRTYGFEGLHGRGLAVATGVKLANNRLNVMVVIGDGDCYGIGGNHFMHSMRRNLDITLIVQNNEVYGLTKGQTSPTSEKGFRTNSTPNGVLEDPVNPITWAIAAGATYVARGYAMDIMHLKKLIVDGVRHKGFSVIDIFQPCTTYNKVNTAEWYKQRIFKLEETDYDPSDKIAAIQMGQMWGDKIPVGLFYEEKGKPTYEDGTPQIATTPLAKQAISNIDISGLLARFR